MIGKVIRSTGSFYQVFVEGETITARLSGKMRLDALKHTNPVAVGDEVSLGEPEGQDPMWRILEVMERKNYLIRKATNLSKQTHILAANVDQIFIVASLFHPRTSTGFIDRILVSAQAYGIPATILLNKKDLLSEEEWEEVAYWQVGYEKAGYPLVVLSAFDPEDLQALHGLVKEKTTLFTGHSGAGKSTLLNQLEPGLGLRTGELSQKHGKGTHTTTFAEMFPLQTGGWVIDTPGIKEFGLHGMSDSELPDYFPEFFALKTQCKFANCVHFNEPGCAVLKALEEGELMPERYANYLQMRESNQDGYRR
jgi:ribosome biogenesis GTPase